MPKKQTISMNKSYKKGTLHHVAQSYGKATQGLNKDIDKRLPAARAAVAAIEAMHGGKKK